MTETRRARSVVSRRSAGLKPSPDQPKSSRAFLSWWKLCISVISFRTDISACIYVSLCKNVCIFMCQAEPGNIPHGVQPCARSRLMRNICLRRQHQTASVSDGSSHRESDSLLKHTPSPSPSPSLSLPLSRSLVLSAHILSVPVAESISQPKLSVKKIIK